MNKAIFLDRDGTINVEVDYLHEVEHLIFIEGVPEALARLRKMGYKLVVISNQSGIGRGFYSEKDVEVLHEHMNKLLADKGAEIDAFYYCPHVESDNCHCRKPETGMIEQAVVELNIDLEQSYMLGDKEIDVLTAIHAGCNYGLVLSGHEVSEEVQKKYQGHVYKNLMDFVQGMEKQTDGMDE